MVTLDVDRAVMGMFAASISAEPTQAVGPSRPLLVTLVCAHAGPASTASSKRIVDLIKNWGGVFDDCFHGSLLVLAAATAALFQNDPPRTGRRRRPDTDSANYRYRSPVSRGRLQKWGNKYGIPYLYSTQIGAYIPI
ncbi:MAG: hypothetical protein OXC57_06810 [Rhodobacteraceae bacterium]|nr:hypothetical protein [Paracoccaceae bacterium]